MDAGTTNRLQIKVFVGFELKVDVSISLNKNSKWKEAKVSKTTNLRVVHYNDQEYIGIFMSHEITTMKMLRETSNKVREELQHFCPENDIAELKVQIFPQVFVS